MTTALVVPRERINVGGALVQHEGFSVPVPLRAKLRDYTPRTDLGRIVRETFRYLPADLAGELLGHISRTIVVQSRLAATKIFGCPIHRGDDIACWDARCPLRHVEPYGVVSEKVITDTGVGFLVDAWQNLTEMENLKYHGIGTGTTAEAASQTALVTELTTEYNPDNTRATGSLTEGATSNIFRTVGTNTLDSGTPVIREHGIFSQAANSGGVLWDRSLFAAITLTGANGDGLQTQYDMTATSGG